MNFKNVLNKINVINLRFGAPQVINGNFQHSYSKYLSIRRMLPLHYYCALVILQSNNNNTDNFSHGRPTRTTCGIKKICSLLVKATIDAPPYRTLRRFTMLVIHIWHIRRYSLCGRISKLVEEGERKEEKPGSLNGIPKAPDAFIPAQCCLRVGSIFSRIMLLQSNGAK